ncbi:hypothetical protein AGABI1DRAFT_51286, partial [Agaricus bisporus var. burnettii JB137-S8]
MFSPFTRMSTRPLSQADLAKQAARLKKRLANADSANVALHVPRSIIQRPWIPVPSPAEKRSTFKVFTWNLLAQCLVRRELFPTSDCLKATQREKMLKDELLSTDADILCLQEVDRLEKVLPILDKAGYSHRYAAGKDKKHGCLIAFKRQRFEQIHERVVFYDDQTVRDATDERAQRGHSFRTKNIGLILALRNQHDPTCGIIVATTHLFWHPKYTYERARQAGILVREVVDLQKQQHAEGWPCIIAGDFNCTPNDAAYSLLTGQPLNNDHKDHLSHSRVTHVSVDPTVPKSSVNSAEDEGESEESDPDRIITNARSATETDGLLNNAELVSLYTQGHVLQSAYNEGLSRISNSPGIALYGEREHLPTTQPGFHEPSYTCYTHYWKSVLDYIFFIPPQHQSLNVTSLLAPHRTEDFGNGLPMNGVCASDHISLAAEFSW